MLSGKFSLSSPASLLQAPWLTLSLSLSSLHWKLTNLQINKINKFCEGKLRLPRGPVVKNLPSSAGNPGSTPGSERTPGVGNENPLQYSCLENLMDSEAWWAIQLMGLQRVRHDSETEYASRHTCEGKLEWSLGSPWWSLYSRMLAHVLSALGFHHVIKTSRYEYAF